MKAAELRALLADRGLSRSTLAARLAIDLSCVHLWAGGRRRIPPGRVDDVLAALNGDLDLSVRTAERPAGGAAPTTVRVGTCGDDCKCQRWCCRACGVYWAGAAGEHVCRAVRT